MSQAQDTSLDHGDHFYKLSGNFSEAAISYDLKHTPFLTIKVWSLNWHMEMNSVKCIESLFEKIMIYSVDTNLER